MTGKIIWENRERFADLADEDQNMDCEGNAVNMTHLYCVVVRSGDIPVRSGEE